MAVQPSYFIESKVTKFAVRWFNPFFSRRKKAYPGCLPIYLTSWQAFSILSMENLVCLKIFIRLIFYMPLVPGASGNQKRASDLLKLELDGCEQALGNQPVLSVNL